MRGVGCWIHSRGSLSTWKELIAPGKARPRGEPSQRGRVTHWLGRGELAMSMWGKRSGLLVARQLL